MNSLNTLMDFRSRELFLLAQLPFFDEIRFQRDSRFAQSLNQYQKNDDFSSWLTFAELSPILQIRDSLKQKITAICDAISNLQLLMKSTYQTVQGNVQALYAQKIKEVRYVEKELTEMLYPEKTEVWNWLDFADIESSDRFQELLKKLEAIQVTPCMEISMQLPYQTLGTQLAQLQHQIQNFQTEFRSLYYKKQILEAILNFDMAFFEERSNEVICNAKKFWEECRDNWVQNIVQTESKLKTRLFSLPLTPENEQKFFRLAQQCRQVQNDAQQMKLLQKQVEELCSNEVLSSENIWLGSVRVDYRSSRSTPTFHVPVETQKDTPIFLVQNDNATPSDEAEVKTFFSNFIFQIIRNTKAGLVEISVVDPVFRGDYLTEFRHKLTKPDLPKQPVGIPDASAVISASGRDFDDLMSDFDQHINQVIAQLANGMSVAEHNEEKSTIKIPHRLLIINDLPRLFSSSQYGVDEAVRKICAVAEHAKRCGITILWCVTNSFWTEIQKKAFPGFDQFQTFYAGAEDGNMWIHFENSRFQVGKYVPFSLHSDALDRLAEFLLETMSKSGEHIDFDEIIPSQIPPFTCKSIDELNVPFGKDVNGKLVFWRASSTSGPVGNTLVIGQPGSGKSNLLHALITSAAYLYSPEELEVYLIDLKEGIEFKMYADHVLPHAKLIAVEGTPELTLGALQKILNDYKTRMNQFKNVSKMQSQEGYENLTRYRQTTQEVLPRVLIVIDEFQNLFPSDDAKMAAESRVLLEEILRKGRAAGFHLILSTQRLQKDWKWLIDLTTTKIALQADEESFERVMTDRHLLKKLKRKGEGCINQGTTEIFRAVYMEKSLQNQYLDQISKAADAQNCHPFTPLIYDGTKFPSPAGNVYDSAMEKLRNSTHPGFVLGESNNLGQVLDFQLIREASENVLIVGKHNLEEADSAAHPLYLSIARSILETAAGGKLQVFLNDKRGYLLPHLQSMPLDQLTSAATDIQTGKIIWKLYHELLDCEQNDVIPEISRFLILLESNWRRFPDLTDTVPEPTPPPSAPETPAGGSRFAALGMSLQGFSSLSSKGRASNAKDTLAYLLKNGGEYGFHVIAASVTTQFRTILDLRQDLTFTFRHILGLQMSESDSNVCFGTNKANRLQDRFALYRNVESQSDVEKFRPFL